MQKNNKKNKKKTNKNIMMSLGSFKNVFNKMFTNHIYLIDMYKQDLALNNLQWLIYHKTQPNQIIYI